MATELRHPKGYVFFDNNGEPLASGTVEYFEAGTTTNEPIYSDAAGSTALPNPITLNSAGRAVDGANNLVAIYLSDAGATDYKEVVKDSGGTTLWTDDDIPQPVDPTASISDFAKNLSTWSTDTASSVDLSASDFGKGRLADTSSNNITYNLPSASSVGNGKAITIKKTSASNTVTVDADGAETIDGSADFSWTDNTEAYVIRSDGANWRVANSYRTDTGIFAGINDFTEDTNPDSDDDLLAIYDDSASGPKKIKPYYTPGAIIAIVEDQKSSSTDGQSLATGADRIRDLNTLVYNRDSLVSLSSDQFTLPAGTWLIKWDAPAGSTTTGSNRHQSLLYNATDTSEVGRGISSSVDPETGGSELETSVSSGSARVSIASSKAFEIRHRVGVAMVGGIALGVSTEVYTRVEIYRA